MVGHEWRLRRSGWGAGEGGVRDKFPRIIGHEMAGDGVEDGELEREMVLTGCRYCTRQLLAETVELGVAQAPIHPVITHVCPLEEADAMLRSIEPMELAGCVCHAALAVLGRR